MPYKLVYGKTNTGQSLDDFQRSIDEMEKKGWSCQGGVAVDSGRGPWIYQLMVKAPKPKAPAKKAKP